MSSLLQSARAISHTLLALHQGEITDDILLSVVDKASAINIIEGQTLDKQELFEILRADFSVGKGEIAILHDDITPWLNEEKANIDFELWNRYKLYMKENDPSFPINDLDDFTDKILDKCVNPKKNATWDRRGMVVGHVQSGKTSNYVGLINKATDAGYKVIIVIAGTISSLRRQTQERIDSGYIGRSSSDYMTKKEYNLVGVGKYKAKTEIYPLTSSYYVKGDEGDFNQKARTPIGKNPVVIVIKKNKGILEKLIDWISKDANIKFVDGSPKLFDVPALIIDDEADAASVNASKSIEDIKTINKLIRTLLTLFNQNTFIGYTATPYANLFIPQEYKKELTTIVKNKEYKIGEDLFPRDFIINIKAPTNYIGAAKIFGLENPNGKDKEPLDIFRPINDYDPPFFKTINKTNKTDLPEYLPKSLKKAIKSFILTCAIRRLRGHEHKHNSMLIHVALLVKWIDRVAYLVNDQLKKYTDAIISEDTSLLQELKELYEKDFVTTTNNILENLDYKDIRIKHHSWESVRKELKKAVSKIDVRAVHGTRSTSNLEYHNIEEIDYERHRETGLSVIAVGGSRLSRGITLEGLSISYYLRTTKMYDSLMQMGRWFGYRPGYVDLCRLYTTEEIFKWFNHITMATEEMRNDFDELTTSHQRPKDFKLKVRNHHGLMTITSLAKLNFSKKIDISFSGSNPQTYLLFKDKKSIQDNFNNLTNLFQRLGFPKEENTISKRQKIRYLLYRNVDTDALTEFIEDYKINIPSINNSVISNYIKLQQSQHNIKEWNICIVSNTSEKALLYQVDVEKKPENRTEHKTQSYKLSANGKTIELVCTVRNQTEYSELYKITKNQIDDVVDRQVDLEESETGTIKERRARERKGLLLIYALDERGTSGVSYGIPIIGYSLHFPKIENEVKTSYTTTIYDGFDDEPQEDDDQFESDDE